MTLRFAINGLGRIGRALVRAAAARPELELVAVNDLAPAASLARLLRHDTVHGRYPGTVEVVGDLAGDDLLVDGRRVAVHGEADPARVPWERSGATVVVEATGRFTRRDAAAAHLRGPVETVLVAAIAEDADAVLCPGVAPPELPGGPAVVSALSCTSHCLALLLAVVTPHWGVRRGLVNETHSVTGNQRLVDGHHPDDPRRGRAAAHNIVPTDTAAPAAVARLFPGLAGRLAGRAVRVPTPDVALLDLVFAPERPMPPGALATAFREAAAGELAGLLGIVEEPVVSSDLVGDPRSAVVDLPLLQEAGDLHRVMAWYDNELAYAHRLADGIVWIAAERVGEKGTIGDLAWTS